MTLFVTCNIAVSGGGGGIGYFSSWILDAPSSIMLIYLLNFSKAFLSGFRKPPKRQKLSGKILYYMKLVNLSDPPFILIFIIAWFQNVISDFQIFRFSENLLAKMAARRLLTLIF